MNWFKKAWERFRYVIEINGDQYLVRYRLFKRPAMFGWPERRYYLHHILRSDADREYHDHPWDFSSLVLWGSYREHRRTWDGEEGWIEMRPWLSFAKRKAGDLHRVELDRPCWTFVVTGPKEHNWGFVGSNNEWIHWEEYENNRHENEQAERH